MKKADPVTGFGIFGTTNFMPLNIVTMIVTGSWKVHCGVLFRFKSGKVVYFEARFKEGFVGPFPFEKLCRWSDSKFYHRLHIRWLNLKIPSIRKKYELAMRMVKNKTGYAKSQLICNWALERLGWPVPTDPTRVTCSESVALIAAPEYDLTDSKRRNPDAVTPGSMWEKLNSLIRTRKERFSDARN